MREPKFDLEEADDQRAVLVIECPECGDKSRFLLDELSHGTSVLCNCGRVLDITDNVLKSINPAKD
jgi:hypothetical protein